MTRKIMQPSLLAIAVVALCVGATAGPAAVATASPPSTAADKPSCTYTLSPPQVVQVSGVNMVTATVTPYPCTGSIVPTEQLVCVYAEGSDDNGECAKNSAESSVQVYFPYLPGTNYVSRGRGCGVEMAGSAGGPQSGICVTLGPYNAVL